MEIVVIRHGETLENLEGICQGQTDGTLSDRGKEQAFALRHEALAMNFDLVITSDLKRAFKTAQILFSSEVPIQIDARLRERGLYSMQGGRLDPSIDYCGHIDGCESMEELTSRVGEFLRELKVQYSHKRIALISHGVTIRVISSICEGISPSETTLSDNCSINKFIIP